MRVLPVLVLSVLLGSGCSREGGDGAKTERSRNAVTDVITQRTAVESGQKAKATIEKVQARRQQDFAEALGESK